MKAKSIFTRETVENRLAWLREQPQNEETRREIEYLEQLKERKGW